MQKDLLAAARGSHPNALKLQSILREEHAESGKSGGGGGKLVSREDLIGHSGEAALHEALSLEAEFGVVPSPRAWSKSGLMTLLWRSCPVAVPNHLAASINNSIFNSFFFFHNR